MKKSKLTFVITFLMSTIIIRAQQGENGINIQQMIELGGVKQWIMIRGTNSSNPVLLFLHGGPGFPEMPFAYLDSRELEKHFLVVNWDQRGCGKSTSSELPIESITVDQLLSDTKELMDYLKARFHKNKFYLIGHSWGSILGLNIASKYPEYLYAYIGMGQVVSILKGEIASYNFALKKANEMNDTISVNKLTSIGLPPYIDYEKLKIQRQILAKFGGAFKSITYPDMIKMMQKSPDYTLQDKGNFMPSFIRISNQLWPQLVDIDFSASILKINVPVYFFLGKYDYGCPYELVEEYFIKLNAPYKEIVWYYESGHWPNLEEPDKYQKELIKIVTKNN